MTKMTLWTDGFDGVTLEGDITLEKYDERTDDFTIRIKRSGLHFADPTSPGYVDEAPGFHWLAEFPIQEVEIEDRRITPVWKPNRYGQPADLNTYQKVDVTDDEVILSVTAGGTAEEVFNRCNPYEVRGSDEKRRLVYNEEYLSSEEYEAKRAEIDKKISDNVVQSLIDNLMDEKK